MKNNIIKILLKNKRVNSYTKLLITLNTLNYYEDYYIPNKKLMNMLKIHKKNIISLLKQLEEDKIIKLFYKGRKRYFVFLENEKEEKKKETPSLYDYNWLEDEE